MFSPLGIAVLFTIIFAALKIAGTSDMSWHGVFMPLYLWVALVVVITVIMWIRLKLDEHRRNRWW